ncbi:MAG: SBBP repeat-containing protein [Candidatus Aminicenantes bacterium]|nr:SBBP repeat-containing protein [Candidatus Aminicenantes bacterium]
MKRMITYLFIIVWSMLFFSASTAKVQGPGVQPAQLGMMGKQAGFGNIPLYFIPNRGQVHEKAKFYAKTPRYTLWMTKEGLVFDGIGKDRERAVSRFVFVGANANPEPEMVPMDVTGHKVNYLKGNDPSQWRTDIQTSMAVLYKNVYQNIDLKVYGMESQIEYDWIVKPGGNPASIRFQYNNVKGARIDESGNLVIATPLGELTHKCPVSYQEGREGRAVVDAKFKGTGENTYGFEVGTYDQGRDLIIDPVVMVYSTYLGGSGDDHGFALALDDSGSAYLTGDTYSDDFPVKGAYRSTFVGGTYDTFVAKFAADGKSLVYSTYLGGSGNDVGEGIEVDGSGKAYVIGITSSTDFPTKNPYQKNNAGGENDTYVIILSAAGSGLTYSTYLGGGGKDEGMAIALDSSNNMYITGRTSSTDFPMQNAYKSSYAGGTLDAFVTKISANGSSLAYSTYLGGSGTDYGYGIAVVGENAYAAGRTSSTNFPTINKYDGSYNGGAFDAFLTKFSSTGSSLIYSTYLGGSLSDSAYGIAVDGSGSAYVVGDTESANFPTKNAVQATHAGGGKDAFVTRFDSTGKDLEYSTFLGGAETEGASHVAIDSSGNAYIIGSTRSSNFPTKRAFQNNYNGDYDVFVSMLPANGYSLTFSTFLGGGGSDNGKGIEVDNSGNIYVVGTTGSYDFPTEDPYQNTLKGTLDAFVCKYKTTEFGTLCGAVDNCSLPWTTGGAADWYEQTTNYYYGEDALQSGPMDSTQSSWVQTTVTGPGLLSFWWDVSSYYYEYGKLKFYIDDVSQAEIYGNEVQWQQATYSIPGGAHTLKWSYEKDYAWSYGADCGWLDKVEFTPLPEIVLNRNQLTFGAFPAGGTGSQTFTISNKTASTLNWFTGSDQTWLSCDPISGFNTGVVTVSVNTTGLASGTYAGTITITDTYASNSPQTVAVTLNIYTAGDSVAPFGEYTTPTDGSTVSSSVPFTGWALDDVGVQSVKLYRLDGASSVYIGDALFVEGARPDVETAYPAYPNKYKAGWGYMMLTNFLPGGNGTFTIVAKATDLEGNETTLGSKTITVDNAHAVKPFGAIDMPDQGETISGSNKRNQGWVLTPLPNTVPKDGSTIFVYIDGLKLGHAAYNVYRPDIAGFFPGYNNSNGALAYYDFDTTTYSNGVHTIVWVATDNAGNADGIGSRYFSIRNTAGSDMASGDGGISLLQDDGRWVDAPGPVDVIKGYKGVGATIEPQRVYPDEEGITRVETRELERVEIRFDNFGQLSGWMQVGDQSRSLPIGSFLDRDKGIFYWQPGPGFVGEYRLVFVETDQDGDMTRKNILVHIVPRFASVAKATNVNID